MSSHRCKLQYLQNSLLHSSSVQKFYAPLFSKLRLGSNLRAKAPGPWGRTPPCPTIATPWMHRESSVTYIVSESDAELCLEVVN